MRAVSRWSVAALVAAFLVPGLPARAVDASPPVQRVEGAAAFSPNGDGERDRAIVRFEVGRRSEISILVRDHASHRVLRTTRIGVRRVGAYRWTWNGLIGRHIADDGLYDLVVRGRGTTGDRPVASRSLTTVVDTRAPVRRPVFDRSIVYPRSTVIEDALRFAVHHASRATGVTASAVVRTRRGSTLARLHPTSPTCIDCTSFAWRAKTSHGVVAPGRYWVRLVVTDAVGNRRADAWPVRVSSDHLVMQQGTIAQDADAATQQHQTCHMQTCPPCPPQPSARFPHGLSFDSVACADSQVKTALFVASPSLPSGPTPADRVRLEATGGPATPGGSATAEIWIPGGAVATMAGDQTAATEWLSAPPGQVMWAVKPAGGAYDIASFRLDYTYYVPSSSVS